MAGRKIRDENEARACLVAANSSQLSGVEWARANGIDARSLNMWRLNFARRDTRSDPLEFLELVPTTATAARHVTTPLRVCRGNLVIEVPDDFDAEHLTRVLRVLASC